MQAFNYLLGVIDWLNQNFWWPLILLVIIILVFFYFLAKRHKPQEKEEIVDYETLLLALGGRDNISKMSLEGNRTKFTLVDLELIQEEGLKDLGATGIFISGKNIKMILPFPTEALVSENNYNNGGNS